MNLLTNFANILAKIMFGSLNIGQNHEDAKENSIKALKMVRCKDIYNKNPCNLSLSERKLVSIASIIAMKPEIIIFDEPTIARDYVGREKILTAKELIKSKQLSRQKLTKRCWYT